MDLQEWINKMKKTLQWPSLSSKFLLGITATLLLTEMAYLSGIAVVCGAPEHKDFLFCDSDRLIGVEGDYVIPEKVKESKEELSEAPPERETTAGEAKEENEALKDDAEKGTLILVNKTHPLEKNYQPEDLTAILYFAVDRSEECRFMRKEAAGAFHEMVEAARRDELSIVMTTAYRSYSFQQMLWESYVASEGEEAAARFSAKPGQSEHQTGLAVDVSAASVDYRLTDEFGKTEEGKWLAANAYRYGFILRYPKGAEDVTGYLYEPWHFRYVGKTAAALIKENDLTLEEFLIEIE